VGWDKRKVLRLGCAFVGRTLAQNDISKMNCTVENLIDSLTVRRAGTILE